MSILAALKSHLTRPPVLSDLFKFGPSENANHIERRLFNGMLEWVQLADEIDEERLMYGDAQPTEQELRKIANLGMKNLF